MAALCCVAAWLILFADASGAGLAGANAADNEAPRGSLPGEPSLPLAKPPAVTATTAAAALNSTGRAIDLAE